MHICREVTVHGMTILDFRGWYAVPNQIEADGPDRKRLAAFRSLLADVHHVAARADDEATMLRDVCDLAARGSFVGLAWVGVPGAAGDLRVAAAAGATTHVAAARVSAWPDGPQGQGVAARAWRDGGVTCARPLGAHPTRRRGRRLTGPSDLGGLFAMRLERGGAPWGIMVFHLFSSSSGRGIGPVARLLLEEVARTVSLGLDRLDAGAGRPELSRDQQLVLDHTYAGISMGRERVLVMANRHLVEMLGYDGPEDLVGRSARILYASDAEYERAGEVFQSLREHGVGRLPDARLVRRDGRELIGDVTMSLVRDGGVETVVWTVEDVTERLRLEAELKEQACSDMLTALPNRRALDLELERAVERARRSGGSLVVGMLDLDDFKTVNDALGHEAGDSVLRLFAGRLTEHVRPSDFVARPGGDEFVVLFEDLGRPLAGEAMEAVLHRLHSAVETPFEVSPEQRVSLEMSLGLAAFPADGSRGEELMRKADRALYDLKTHKLDRARWWQLAAEGAAVDPELEPSVDGYDAHASTLLAAVQDVIGGAAEDFVAAFYRRLAHDGEAANILSSLDQTSMDRLKATQAEHLGFLLNPSTTQQDLRARAGRLGEVHHLVGVEGALLTRAMALYRELLTERLNQAAISARQRYRVLLVAERRLQDDLEGELQAMQGVTTSYLNALSRPLPATGTRWVDAAEAEMAGLAQLPGVAAVILLRFNADGRLTVEHSAAQDPVQAERLHQLPLEEGLRQTVGDTPGPTVEAWREGQTLTAASFADDPRFVLWRDMAQQFGVRSMLAIPIPDASGHTGAGVCVYGRYPYQFESPFMRQFAQSVARRWEDVWRRTALPNAAAALPQDVARSYRRRLFDGGLRMFFQPVVDLRDGRVVKVEALARLRQSDGTIVSPAVFLPLLGDVELAHLFQLGLDQALGYLAQWEAQGIRLDLAVNLAPSTLLLPECERWVREGLSRHGVAPERLTLELLEAQTVDEAARDAAIDRLVSLGVHLAIDDLGSGYSSLQRLSALPFDTIKIDQGLVRRLRTEPLPTLVVLDTLTEMGRRLGREVVVEGLEDRGEIEVAALLGSPFGQGFGLARPMPGEEVASWWAQFALPIEPGKAHTYIGARAHHWKHGHAMAMALCPVTGLIAERGLQGRDADGWHVRAHAVDEGDAALQALTAWLDEQVHEEARATGS